MTQLQKTAGLSKGTSVVLSVGLIVLVLFVVTILSIQFVPGVKERLAALLFLSSRSEYIAIELSPETVQLNNSFSLTYSHTGKIDTGSYLFTYPCFVGIQLEKESNDTFSFATTSIPCDQEISLVPDENQREGSLSLRATVAKAETSALPIEIIFVPSGSTMPLVRGKTAVIIEADKADIESENVKDVQQPLQENTQPVITYVPETIITAGSVTSNTYQINGTVSSTQIGGRPDLAVRIIETGVVDKQTGNFSATTSFKSSDRIAVKFEVRNDGGRETGSWYFNAVLPTFPSHIFTSDSQQSLIPGARTEFVLGFDSISMIASSEREFVINADPASTIGEPNEENNIARIKIENVTP